MSGIIDWLKGTMSKMPDTAYTWGFDMVKGIAKGMDSASGYVRTSAIGIAGIISSYLHFSVPDKGPLTTYESWMPDFVKGMAAGINSNKEAISKAISGVADGFMVLSNSGVASPATAMDAVGYTTNNRSVSQNVNINNTFNGDRAIQQNTSSAMDSAAQDVTSELARGLAYAR
jgi:hypothetical protein